MVRNNIELKKYQIIVNDLQKDIRENKYKKNELLPSETKLIQIYGISRITVRKSLDILERMGLIYKIQGKGCFVLDKQVNQSLLHIHSYTEEIINAGMTPRRKILQSNVITMPSDFSTQLRLPHDSSAFFLERLIYADHNVLCLVESTLPYGIFSKIEEIDFENKSLYEVLQTKYNVPISRTNLDIGVICINEEIAKKMELPLHTPLLYLTIVAYHNKENKEIPIEISHSYYNPQIIKYTVDKTINE